MLINFQNIYFLNSFIKNQKDNITYMVNGDIATWEEALEEVWSVATRDYATRTVDPNLNLWIED